MADVGTGATLAFTTGAYDNWAAEILSMNGSGRERPVIDTSHLGTTGYNRFMPGDLVNPGTLDVTVAFDPDEPPPIDHAPEMITVTFPVPVGKSSGAQFTSQGFISSDGFAVPFEDRMTMDVTIQFTGDDTNPPTWADAS